MRADKNIITELITLQDEDISLERKKKKSLVFLPGKRCNTVGTNLFHKLFQEGKDLSILKMFLVLVLSPQTRLALMFFLQLMR